MSRDRPQDYPIQHWLGAIHDALSRIAKALEKQAIQQLDHFAKDDRPEEWKLEVSNLGRGEMIRFGKQIFHISETALLGIMEAKWTREKEGDPWELTLEVGGISLMGEWLDEYGVPEQDEIHYTDGRIRPLGDLISEVERTIEPRGHRVAGIWIPERKPKRPEGSD